MAADIQRRTEKVDSNEEAIEAEESIPKTYIVSCTVVDAFEEELPEPARIGPQQFLDQIDAESENEAKDVVTGFMAERDFIVEKWNFVSEAEKLGDAARALNP